MQHSSVGEKIQWLFPDIHIISSKSIYTSNVWKASSIDHIQTDQAAFNMADLAWILRQSPVL